jgi:hypothetical protein
MWHQRGTVDIYTYHQDQSRRYGDAGTRLLPFRFARNSWYAVYSGRQLRPKPEA